MPAAMATAAKAMGKTDKEFIKMMKKGEVVAAEFWPKFFKEYNKLTADGLAKAMNSFTAVENRFKNSLDRLSNSIFKNILEDGLKGMMGSISSIMNALTAIISGPIGKGLGDIFYGATIPLQLMSASVESLIYLIRHLGVRMGITFGDETNSKISGVVDNLGTLAGVLASLWGTRKIWKWITGAGTAATTTAAAAAGAATGGRNSRGRRGASRNGGGVGGFGSRLVRGGGYAALAGTALIAADTGYDLLKGDTSQEQLVETLLGGQKRSDNILELLSNMHPEILSQRQLTNFIEITVKDSEFSDVIEATARKVSQNDFDNFGDSLGDSIIAP